MRRKMIMGGLGMLIFLGFCVGNVAAYLDYNPEVKPASNAYKGKTLNVLVCSGFLSHVWHLDKDGAQEWAKITGAKVNVIETAFVTLLDKIMAELIAGTGAYDIIQYQPWWNGDILEPGFLIPLDDYIEEKPVGYLDYLPVYRDRLSKWRGKIYTLQIDGDVWPLAYRVDLFGDPDLRAKFQAEYGYEFRPPKTWEEYLEVAEFISKEVPGVAGCVVMCKPPWTLIYEFFSRLAAYLKTPYNYEGGIYFDPDTMEPLINTPAGVRALDNLIKSVSPTRSPKGVLGYGWSEEQDAFITGKAAMATGWPDLGPLSLDPDKSKIIGKAGFALTPGSYEVWNTVTKKWERTRDVHAGSMLVAGWCLGIPKDSRNKDAAYDLMRFMVTGERSIYQAICAVDGMDPYRESQFASSRVQKAYEKIPTFLPALRANILQGIPELRIPGAREYWDACERYLSEALEKKVTPQEALDKAALEWKKITLGRGFDRQRAIYRDTLGLD